MTLREAVEATAAYPAVVLAVFTLLPLIPVAAGFIHERGAGRFSPWKYVYAAVVFLCCIPGIFAAVLTGYALFFTRENLLDVNALVYFLPIVSMILTLFLVGRNVSFDHIPGFDRLSGLIVLIAITFILALGISKTRVWLFFGSSFLTLLILIIVLFALLRWGAHALFRSRHGRSVPPRP